MPTDDICPSDYLDFYRDALRLLLSIEEKLETAAEAVPEWDVRHTETLHHDHDPRWELVAVTSQGFYWKRKI